MEIMENKNCKKTLCFIVSHCGTLNEGLGDTATMATTNVLVRKAPKTTPDRRNMQGDVET